MIRTHKIGELNEKLIGKKVRLCGWVETIRGHGKLIFIDLRDRYGLVQAVITQKEKDFENAKKLTSESCIMIEGIVKERPKGTENKNIGSGKVEVGIEKLEIFNLCPPLPFDMAKGESNEEIRLKYRYLDLRRNDMQKNILLRNEVIKAIRDFMHSEDFIEIETPLLAKSTPEGSRDYVVPSRIHQGKFYALPQSPQLFKQLLMVSGFDKYFQIAKCMRDEDLRADRQPEFTQLDIEMSFIDKEDLIDLIERLMKNVFKKTRNIDIKIPFKRMTHKEAMEKYGTDKPDLRKNKNDKDELAFCWIVDFPLFEYSKEEKRHVSSHHPFTMPNMEDFRKDKTKARSEAYDLALNGIEIGGGSIRIHNLETQKEIFNVLGINEQETQKKFGFLLEALSFGAPPHGGIAFGIDRLLQIMSGTDSIREVIAFPKNRDAKDVMLDAPSEISEKQLKEAHISIIGEKNLPKEKKKTKK